MTRKRIRENLYIMLFQTNFYEDSDHTQQAEIYLEDLSDPDATKKAKAELKDRFEQVLSHLEEIDKKIEEKSKGWVLSRIAKVDLKILRMAVFEMVYDEQVPAGVAINEAVELSKKYGTDKSYRFVNGILASIAKELSKEEEQH